MKHNPAFGQRNVRSVCKKLDPSIKVTGNAKPMAAIERKARKVVPPCIVYRGQAATVRAIACGIQALIVE